MQTDITIPDNKPDTITHDNNNGTFMLIYVAVSGERQVIKKEAEKILKHRDLTKEKERNSAYGIKKKRELISVVIVTTETTSVSLRKYLSHMSGKLSIKKPQIGAMLGTAYYFRKY